MSLIPPAVDEGAKLQVKQPLGHPPSGVGLADDSDPGDAASEDGDSKGESENG